MRRAPVAASVLALALAAPPALADPHPEARRIVAIGGSVTEFVYALGQQDRLVARDTTSYMPPEAMALPDVGYMRQLSAEGVLSVRPDLILAEEGAGPPETIALLKSSGIPYEEIPTGASPGGVMAKAVAVAEALATPDPGVVAALKADLDAAAAAAAAVDEPLRVLFALSLQGGRVHASGTGTEAEAIIEMAGGRNEKYENYHKVQILDEAVIAAAPDVILMMDRGDGVIDPQLDANTVFAHPSFALTPAAAKKAFVSMDGLYLLGFGPRTVKAALDLHRALYGDG